MAPPKRGKIKAQIMEEVADAVTSMASKAGEKLAGLFKNEGTNSGGGGGGGGDSGGSASSSPTTSPNNNGG